MLVALSLLVTGCDAPDSESKDNGPDALVNAQEAPILELDGGKKWIISPAMRVPIDRMKERLRKAFDDLKNGAYDQEAVIKGLNADIDELVFGCDMEGKAHDELHDWLLPHVKLVQELEKNTDPERTGSLLNDLDRSCATFERYFE